LNRLADFGKYVGIRVLDLFFLRVGKDKREVRLTPMLVFIQKVFWKVNDNLEQHAQQANICMYSNFCILMYRIDFYLDYLIERECLINKFIFFPKDKDIEMISKKHDEYFLY